MQNLGFCDKCKQPVPARHDTRGEQVYLVKECPACGPTEALVSSDVRRWEEKRDVCGYDPETARTCSLKCVDCNHGKSPSLVFLDVTNRCNMNCPICLANVQSMGFQFDPPMEYFEKVFAALGRMKPRPKVQLFGGEPTVRNDLIDIIKRAKKHGLSARVVTNGLRMADEEYCKALLGTGTQLMFAFDGRDPAIYRKIRKSDSALGQKLKALENVRKHHKSKATIMCCAGLGVNDDKMDDMIRFCHEGRDYIAALDLIPLVETWGPDTVDAGNTTITDVEKMIEKALPGVDFIPAGMFYKLPNLQKTFNVGRLTFGGAHPNCESVTALVSDGEAYRPAARYLKGPLGDAVKDVVEIDRSMTAKFEKSWIARLFGRKGRQIVMGMALLRAVRRHVNFREVFGTGATLKTAKILWGAMRGVKMKHLLRRYTKCHGVLRVIVLPFEEPMSVESARLVECPASFAYEHPVTQEIRLMPVCSWTVNKNDILRATAKRYGVKEQETVAAALAL